MSEAGADSHTNRSTPTPQPLQPQPNRAQLGSANSSLRGLHRGLSQASLSTASSALHGDALVDKELANGARTLINGIAFPTSVAKKIPGNLLRASKYTANPFLDSIVLTCFVELELDPPRPLLHDSPKSSKAEGSVSKAASVAGDDVASSYAKRPLSGQSARPGSRDLNNRAVKFTSSPSDEPLGGISVQHSNTSSPRLKGKAAASPQQNPTRMPSMSASGAAAKTSGRSFSFGGGQQPESPLLHGFLEQVQSCDFSGNGGGADTPRNPQTSQPYVVCDPRHCPRGPYNVRVPCSATVAEATQLVQEALRSRQLHELHEMHHANNGGTLFGQRVDVDKAIAALTVPSRKLQALNATTVSSRSLGTMALEIPPPGGELVVSSSGGLAATTRLTLRPCDPLGFVIDRSASEGVTLPPSKRIQACFPKNTLSYFVCLAPDPEADRMQIRQGKLVLQQEARQAVATLESTRSAVVQRVEMDRTATEVVAHGHSLQRATALRIEMSQPKGSASYKLFQKLEVQEEKQRKRELAQLETERHRKELSKAAKAFWLESFMAVTELEQDAARQVAALLQEEQAAWVVLAKYMELDFEVQQRSERCAVLLWNVPLQVEAMRAAHSPFAKWSL